MQYAAQIVTAEHWILVGYLLCKAETLVNVTTIVRDLLSELGGIFTVFRVETYPEEIILASGILSAEYICRLWHAFEKFVDF